MFEKSIRSRMLRRNILALLAAMLMMLSTPLSILAAPASGQTKTDETPVDFVLVLDCSGTMSLNDKEGWTATATNSFVDFIGEANTRLSVITVGPSYGGSAYPVGVSDPKSNGRVSQVVELQTINDALKKNAKAAITSETKKLGDWTPLGYGLQAACDILQKHDSADDHACIIVMSDGYVEGQTDYVGSKAKDPHDNDYKSIQNAKAIAEEHGWAIYPLELNLTKKSEGKHIMREVLPGTYGKTTTKPYEVTSANEAIKMLQQIYTSYFNTEVEEVKKDGTFIVDEMTAEQTLILTGEIDKIHTLDLVSPSKKTESFEYTTLETITDDRRVIFDKNSAVVKMIMPEEGKWTLKVDGEDMMDLDLEVSSISLKEMNLVLNVEGASDGDELENGTTLNMEAYFEYNHTKYESVNFYKKYAATLKVNGQSERMESSPEGYSASYTFDHKGSYVVQAVVESSIFREGSRKSGSFTFNINNSVTVPKGEIPELTCNIGEETEVIDLNDYFEDDDPLSFNIKKQNSFDDYVYDLSADGKLTLKSGNTASNFTVRALANDGSGEDDAVQTIHFTVLNRPIMYLNEDIYSLQLNVGEKYTVEYSELFTDPDGAAPDVRVIEEEEESDENEAILVDDSDPTKLVVTARKAGSVKLDIVGIDGNTDSVALVILMDVTAISAASAFVHNFWWLIALAAILLIGGGVFLILLFTGRKIYGKWDIEINGDYQQDIEIAGFKSCKGAVVSLDRLIGMLDGEPGFPKVELVAGNRFNNNVSIRNVSLMDAVIVNGDPIEEDVFKDKKYTKLIKRGASVELQKDGMTVVLNRVS